MAVNLFLKRTDHRLSISNYENTCLNKNIIKCKDRYELKYFKRKIKENSLLNGSLIDYDFILRIDNALL